MRYKLQVTRNADDIIEFGKGQNLSTVIKPPSGHQAHHIIPMQFFDHPLVQEGAKFDEFWHMNEMTNGLALPLARHSGFHNNYNAQMSLKLQKSYEYLLQNNNFTPSSAADELRKVANQVRSIINQNPNTHLNELTIQ